MFGHRHRSLFSHAMAASEKYEQEWYAQEAERVKEQEKETTRKKALVDLYKNNNVLALAADGKHQEAITLAKELEKQVSSIWHEFDLKSVLVDLGNYFEQNNFLLLAIACYNHPGIAYHCRNQAMAEACLKQLTKIFCHPDLSKQTTDIEELRTSLFDFISKRIFMEDMRLWVAQYLQNNGFLYYALQMYERIKDDQSQYTIAQFEIANILRAQLTNPTLTEAEKEDYRLKIFQHLMNAGEKYQSELDNTFSDYCGIRMPAVIKGVKEDCETLFAVAKKMKEMNEELAVLRKENEALRLQVGSVAKTGFFPHPNPLPQ